MQIFAVAAILATKASVLCSVIEPSVALITQNQPTHGPLDFLGNPIPQEPVTIAAPVVSIVEKPVMPSPSIAPPRDLRFGRSALEHEPTEPVVLVQTIDERNPQRKTVLDVNQIENEGREVVLLPEPLANTVSESKLKGNWYDEQKLSLETFKEVVATDVDNVWVVAYVDPRCRDCLQLSIEWERLT